VTVVTPNVIVTNADRGESEPAPAPGEPLPENEKGVEPMAYDYIIVGAGTAGCVLANRLSEDPEVSVLVLEAGTHDRTQPMTHIPGGCGFLLGKRVNWAFHTVPQPELNNRRIWFPQGKTLGGCSAINAMIYIRGQKEDYDGWAALGNTGWGYDDMLPYFKKSEDNSRIVNEYHSQGGPQAVSDQTNPHRLSTAFVAAAQEYGIPYNADFNGATQEGVGVYQTTQRAALRRSQARSFLIPVAGRRNLTIKTKARVLRVVTENNRAVGVEISQYGRQSVIRANREVIVSSGALNSPRLLLLSGIGPADELKAVGVTPVLDSPEVGKNLHDHMCTNVQVGTKEPISYSGLDRFPKMIGPGLEYLAFRRGPAASIIVEAGAFVKSPKATRPDMQIHIAPAFVVRGGLERIEGHGFTINTTYLRPKSRGEVRISSPNPSDEPLIDPRYASHPEDREMALTQIRTVRGILSQPSMAALISDERMPGKHLQTDEELWSYVREYGGCDYHPVGTCRMGPDESSVVDTELRVRGIEGLRVVDASIAPTAISGNTMAPTMAIAEKAADLIKAARVSQPARDAHQLPTRSGTRS
jgi:choline dehydrogenase-like flavoprotein